MKRTKHLIALLTVVVMVFTFGFGVLAACKSNKYTITIDANGGKFGSETTTTVETDSNGVVASAPTAPTRDGYTLKGYNTSKTGKGDEVKFGAEGTVFEADTTVYAQWELKSPTPSGGEEDKIFDITIDANGGEFEEGVTEVKQTTGKDGKLATLPTPTLDGFVCIGFNTQKDSSGDDVDTDYVFSEDTTIYAQWMDENDIVSVKVTLVVGNGTLPAGSKTVYETEYGLIVEELPIPESNEAHWQFVGWYTKQTGGSLVIEEDTVFTEDCEIYARYVRDDGVWVNDKFGAELPLNAGNTSNWVEYWLGDEDTKISLKAGDIVTFFINGKQADNMWITGMGVKIEVDPKPNFVTVTTDGDYMIFLKDHSGGAGTDYVVEFRASTEAGSGGEEDIPVGAAAMVITVGSFKPITLYLAKANGTGVTEAELSKYCIYTFSDEIFGSWTQTPTNGRCATKMTATATNITKIPKGWIIRTGWNTSTGDGGWQTANIEDAIKEGGTYVIQLPVSSGGVATVTEIVKGA